jgi:hypothetical protein
LARSRNWQIVRPRNRDGHLLPQRKRWTGRLRNDAEACQCETTVAYWRSFSGDDEQELADHYEDRLREFRKLPPLTRKEKAAPIF